jgi:hypothetical protein
MAHKTDIREIASILRWNFDYLVDAKEYINIILKLIENPDDRTLDHIELLLCDYQTSEECYLTDMDFRLRQLVEFAEESK